MEVWLFVRLKVPTYPYFCYLCAHEMDKSIVNGTCHG